MRSKRGTALLAIGWTGLLAGLLSGTTCFPKQCEDDTYCVRECNCESSAGGGEFACPIQLACNTGEGVCAAEYNELTCEEICQQVAARSLCGSKRCTGAEDCVRSATCLQFDPETGQQIGSFECDLPFACDPDAQVCEEAYVTTSDDQVCQECAAQQGG